uniref:Uncharacterized protein n=1 Tax=Anopheles atroparvus TaxID=41427 RepID=A0AAG5DNN1_ANOAO
MMQQPNQGLNRKLAHHTTILSIVLRTYTGQSIRTVLFSVNLYFTLHLTV